MTKTSTEPTPTPETVARWWVQLNCWVWPDDLPGKPNPPWGIGEEDLRNVIRGAHAVIDLFANEELVDALWRDENARRALVS
jgi:hypothetical protein